MVRCQCQKRKKKKKNSSDVCTTEEFSKKRRRRIYIRREETWDEEHETGRRLLEDMCAFEPWEREKVTNSQRDFRLFLFLCRQTTPASAAPSPHPFYGPHRGLESAEKRALRAPEWRWRLGSLTPANETSAAALLSVHNVLVLRATPGWLNN